MNANGILSLFKSYLCNKQDHVKIGAVSSTTKISNIGVPQGSRLGPILFLIYINDLPNVSSTLQTMMFADDTTFSLSGDSYDSFISGVGYELVKVQAWCNANKPTINAEKTEVIRVTNRSFELPEQCLVLENKILDFKKLP